MTTNAKSVPEWARDKARNLLIESSPVTYTPSLWIVDVVASLIAEHEEAPVDPLLAVALHAMVADPDAFARQLSERMNQCGITIVRIERVGEQK